MNIDHPYLAVWQKMSSKTAAAVLQELMVKHNETAEYECTALSSPQLITFRYQCAVGDVVETANARSKKEAKQEVARRMLLKLSSKGYDVPSPYGTSSSFVSSSSSHPSTFSSSVPQPAINGPRSYVALLMELCTEYNLPAVEYDLIADTGPPHQRHFTIKAKIGSHERCATSTTKKAARQLAAEQLYKYLRDNLSRLTKDFVEADALSRAHEKAMDRYKEVREENVWRPDLGQKISDYPVGLLNHIESEMLEKGLEALERTKDMTPENRLEIIVKELGLEVQFTDMETESYKDSLVVVEIKKTSPELALAGFDRNDAAMEALDYIQKALKPLVC